MSACREGQLQFPFLRNRINLLHHTNKGNDSDYPRNHSLSLRSDLFSAGMLWFTGGNYRVMRSANNSNLTRTSTDLILSYLLDHCCFRLAVLHSEIAWTNVSNGAPLVKTAFNQPNQKEMIIVISENIRYYLSVSCLALGSSIPIMGAIVWVITEFIPLEGRALKIAYIITYIPVALVSMRFYIPRLRGVA